MGWQGRLTWDEPACEALTVLSPASPQSSGTSTPVRPTGRKVMSDLAGFRPTFYFEVRRDPVGPGWP